MSTSDSGSFPVTNTLSDSPDFVSGILDPRILARMANEFFSALPETGTVPAAPVPVDPSIASPVTAPVPASVPAFPSEVSLPSDPHFPSVPASAGAASASPVTAPAVTSPPAVPAGTASVVPAEPPAAFSFLQEARPLFGASDPAPSPYPEARPIIEFLDSEPHPIAEPSAAEQKSMP
jgi:cysteine desulfurase/selenocysteine lyase